MTIKLSLNRLYAYIIAFLILFDGSVMWQLTGNKLLSVTVIRLLLVAICMLSIFTIGKVEISLKFFNLFLASFIFFIIYALATRYDILNLFKVLWGPYLIFLFYAYIMLRNGKINDLVEAFVNIILIIAILTTFLWISASLLRIVPLRLGTYDWAEKIRVTYNFYNIYFENPVQNTNFLQWYIPRNTGIYAEAPGFSNYLLYAFGLELSFLGTTKFHRTKLLIFFVASLTTLSTKAILFLVSILIINYLLDEQKKRHQLFQLIRFFLSIVLVGVGAYIFVFVIDDKMTTGSFSIRTDDFYAAIKTWMQHPVFGTGLGNVKEIVSNFTVRRDNDWLSMGLSLLLAQGGLFLTAFYLLPTIVVPKIIRNNELRKSVILFSIAVLINLIISNIITSPALEMILASAYAYLALNDDERARLAKTNVYNS